MKLVERGIRKNKTNSVRKGWRKLAFSLVGGPRGRFFNGIISVGEQVGHTRGEKITKKRVCINPKEKSCKK